MTNPSSDNTSQGASYSQCAYNMTTTLAAIAGPALIAYFAAPYLALATRAIFPAAYALVIGPPSTIGYYSTYIPAREYACTMVYNNSHIIVGTASATVQAAKKIVSSIANCSAGFFASSKSDSSTKEPSIQHDIETGELRV
ncbi:MULTISPECIES: hypothetical protein [unclassified Legionella]|uniref:hypothetical protein n=1 Tax=unclassified Legionella TaxID=2622702 RepID=UPI001E62ADA8|nr:hypothetical protein [Legionella sp. 31fI33]MCC5014048.1 hypothetical protein [Legionella sp. 31fI33]